jgi:hypothetical protein
MMDAHWTERLSDYLDGELGPEERAAADRHLGSCAECSAVLQDLRAVATSAGLLPDEPPRRDLWPDIRARLTPRSAPSAALAASPAPAPSASPGRATGGRVVPISSRRRLQFSIPQLMAAGLALMVISAAAVWVALGGSTEAGSLAATSGLEPAASPAASPAAWPATSPDGSPAPVAERYVLASYEPAMAELEVEYARRVNELDPETIRVVERNLAIIDVAIREAREALAADPSSQFLHTHLVAAVRWRMDLLRQAASI